MKRMMVAATMVVAGSMATGGVATASKPDYVIVPCWAFIQIAPIVDDNAIDFSPGRNCS